ncbi:PH domain-containing protein [Bacillus cereus group sp. BfR-BA-01379]|uniref:PH domain-containing protein n=1 Tax=Bacillus cereus group sp. BfR-BA-01379 TaxID=2920323 RepID=UPI001F58D5EF|nr:PH domain-containing protein [Bacillus cereus group sp. BfR-BA-01379]
MQPLEREIHSNMLKVWRIHALIGAAVILAVVIAYFFFMINFNWWGWLFGLLVTGAITFIPLDYFVFPNLRQRYYSYRLNEEEIEIQKGMFVVKRVLIPMMRVQHVTIEQGPIMRKYNLAELHISTAATSHSIPGLTKEEAEQLKRQIGELAKVSEEDV